MAAEQPVGAESSRTVRSEYGTLLEQVAVAVFGLDVDHRIRFWGPGAQRLFGHEAPDVLSRHGSVLFPGPEDPPPAPGAPGHDDPAALLVGRGMEHGYWRVRLPARHRDGTVFDCGFRVFPVSGPGDGVVLALASRGDELDRVKTNLAFLDALFETCPIGLVMLDEDLRFLHLNQALADMDGLGVAEHLGRRVDDVMITRDGGEFLGLLRAVVEGGPPVVGTLVGMRGAGRPDHDQVRSVSLFPLSGAVGSRTGVGGVLLDVTDREHAVVEATAARQRLDLLDRASRSIGRTLDVGVTARELVDASVPAFCDAAVVEVVQGPDDNEVFDPSLPLDTHRIAWGTVLPPPADELVGGLEFVSYPPGSTVHDMVSTGRPVVVPVDEDFVSRTVAHRDRARLLRESGLVCLLMAPLIARGAVRGIAMFGRSAARPGFTAEDAALAGELASRAALCLDNARLYSRVQDAALTLQRALLPTAPATSPYVDVAHRYVPGSRASEVGGDWYDVVHQPGNRVALIVGDVMGHGVRAAAAMGRLRITAKAVARHVPEPSALLAELEVCAQEAGIELATCLYLVYDPDTGRARVANAGHPPPMVIRPDGSVGTVEAPAGIPLGVGGCAFDSTDVELPDGALLALYTDGLVEARGQDIDVGMAALWAALGRARGSLEDMADQVLGDLLPGRVSDDTVLVLARVRRAG
ncbi:SpoIIE family protein phosphatase [Streptomyces ficellus]|uniref:protein-serine/threonine phosphatase n=1 Tax=Streptomyces ficellus TaxID=1977088 RepID=A0A6I6FA36_9ACTN|nr:SpoIIE family protein phosphatase [Streptomyces ficellus]QGV77787.1 PAS domain S-box protein [Streptomyces ficellus]